MNTLAAFSSLDTTALTDQPAPAEVAAFRAASIRDGSPWTRRPIRSGAEARGVGDVRRDAVPLLFVVAVILLVAAVAGPRLLVGAVHATADASGTVRLIVIGALLVLVLVIVVNVWRLVLRFLDLRLPAAWWADELRITGFARANGLRYGHEEAVDLPGVIFREGWLRTAERRFSRGDIEVGVYRYGNAPGPSNQYSTTIHRWGYAAVRLGSAVPNVLLDAAANDRRVLGVRRSDLPGVDSFSRDQRVEVGDGFDRAFTVWAPVDYRRDAQRLITPELAATLLAHAGTFDIEFVDDSVFFSSPAFDVLDPDAWARWTGMLTAVVPALLRSVSAYRDDHADAPLTRAEQIDEALSRHFVFGEGLREGTYRDDVEVHERIPSARVATGGRRLRRSRPVIAAVVLVVIAAAWIATGAPMP